MQTSPIASLIPYEFNNRNHPEEQINLIANSIKEFGFNQPIVIDESNIILVGHGRFLAAQKLALKEVPTLQLKHLTEAQKKAYRILDNKLQNDSTWSFDNLALELDFLQEEGFDLEAWGLDSLQNMFPEEELEVYEDSVPAVPEETFIKLGDLIELGEHRVLCGDSTNAEQVTELIDGATVKMIHTDPPYGLGGYGGRNDMELKGDDEDVSKFYDCIPTDIKERYIWGNYKNLMYHIKDEPRDVIIWVKNNFGLGRGYRGQYEMCFYYGEFNESDSDVWEEDKDTKYEHPTQKPLTLPRRAIKNSSAKGDLVLDLFLGSGSTLIAADQLNRICCGMEISPKYCQVIIQRYKNHCEKVNKPFKCKINGELYYHFGTIKDVEEIRA